MKLSVELVPESGLLNACGVVDLVGEGGHVQTRPIKVEGLERTEGVSRASLSNFDDNQVKTQKCWCTSARERCFLGLKKKTMLSLVFKKKFTFKC